MRKILASLLVVGLLAGSASAMITAEWVPVVPGAGYPAGGYETWDLMVTTGTNVAAAQMHLVPDTSGTIYQHAFGGNTGPNPALIVLFPELAYDTYVTMPPAGDIPDTVATQTIVDIAAALAIPVPPTPYPVGSETDPDGAGPLPPVPNPPPFDIDQWSIGWAVNDGSNLYGPGTHQIARVTILSNATGNLWFFVKGTDEEAAGTGLIHLTLPGFVPEPATLLVLALGGLASLIRRR